jgi:hypothetical protein
VRQLRKLPKDVLGRLRAATEALRNQPRPPGAVKLAGTDNLGGSGSATSGWSTQSLTRSG